MKSIIFQNLPAVRRLHFKTEKSGMVYETATHVFDFTDFSNSFVLSLLGFTCPSHPYAEALKLTLIL